VKLLGLAANHDANSALVSEFLIKYPNGRVIAVFGTHAGLGHGQLVVSGTRDKFKAARIDEVGR
jgi:hypothetical protein